MPGGTRSSARRSAFGLIVALGLLPAAASAQCDSVNQWQPWEKTISLAGASNLGANPYRDYVIQVNFHNSIWGSFTQDAFWDNDPANPKAFKIRAALPAGTGGISTTWSWDTIACTPTAGGACPAITWSLSSGCISVQAATGTGVKIFDNGFLKQYSIVGYPGGLKSYSPLFYWNDTPFFWLGDTAWAAPPREISGQTTSWVSYLGERHGKFTVIQIAPAVTWQPKIIPPEFTPLPLAPSFSFDQTAGASTDPLPNVDSKPLKTYWDKLDTLVAQANQQDLVVFVGGLIDPTDRGGESGARYPRVKDAKSFARYLAARLANRAVILSPGFDDRLGDLTKDNVALSSALDQVGQAIHAAAPRTLLTNHLAGNTPCSDYEMFRSVTSWVTFFAYQSGHGGGNITSPAGTVCGSPYSTETAEVSATRRAIEMPLTLTGSTHPPSLPTFNAEGPYDTVPAPTPLPAVDNRYRVRQVAYSSSLSNAMGFTYGVVKLSLWDHPLLSTFQAESAKLDMTNFRLHLENRAPILRASHSWILGPQAGYDKRVTLATDGSSLVIAYLPSPSSGAITLNTSGLPGLSCAWTAKWYNPLTNQTGTPPKPCQPVQNQPNQILLTRPDCVGANADCDWLLELTKGSAAFIGSSLAPGSPRIDVWAEPSVVEGAPAIRASVTTAGGSTVGTSAIVSPEGGGRQQNPRIAPLEQGALVVWQADDLDGSLSGVFAQSIDGKGRLTGPRMQVNLISLENQIDPAIAIDALGNGLILWSSYGQDGDRGGIFARRFDTSGHLVGGEIAVNAKAVGHQENPQIIALPGGRFVAAWETRAEGADSGGVSFRLFDSSGRAMTGEISVPGTPGLLPRLVNLDIGPLGTFHLDWALTNPARGAAFLYSRSYSAAGAALGNVMSLP
jgi:hypothetical protein